MTFLTLASCTNFQDAEVSTDVLSIQNSLSKLSFKKDGGRESVTFTCGSRWNVSKPDWVELSVIDGNQPFTWVLSAACAGNSGEAREGELVITNSATHASKTIKLTQESSIVHVWSVKLDSAKLTLIEGRERALKAVVLPSNANDTTVTWSSDNPSVAGVSQAGLVSALEEGTARITVTTNDGGKTDVCTVTVKPIAVESVGLDKSTLFMVEGESDVLTATVAPPNAKNMRVTWSSSNNSVATVSSSGTVRAVGKGTATITVRTEDGDKTATCEVTVTARKIDVTDVSLDKASLTLVEGDSETLTAIVSPSDATDKTVTWSSDKESVATVTSSGVVKAVNAGTAKITVTTKDGGKSATCDIAVTPKKIKVTDVSLDKTSLTLVEGDSETLTAIVSPSDATDKSVSWSTSDKNVASVDENGLVKAVKKGNAIITVTSVSDPRISAACTVTVSRKSTAREYVDLGLSVKWGTCNLGADSPEEHGDYYAWGETEPYYSNMTPFTWKSGKSSGYAWASYKWCGGSNTTLTKYNYKESYGNNPDYKVVLENSDDVAAVKLGGKWRIPTDTEWAELRTKCIWTSTTQDGVKGYSVTGPNGNSIFLPAAGRINQATLQSVGSYGDYWSSSLNPETPDLTLYLYFDLSNVNNGSRYRYTGHSVRPVYGESVYKAVTAVSLDRSSLALTVEDKAILTPVVTPSYASVKAVLWSSSNTAVASVSDTGEVTALKEGSATITVTTVDGGYKAGCEVTVTKKSESREYVDLGLSVMWATVNIGADLPEETGSYFSWGETEPRLTFSWSNYKYGSQYNPSKYNDNDKKTVLDAGDDAATSAWGSGWRTPTKAEWDELISSCTWTMTRRKGVYGYEFRSRKYSDRTIFLPGAGQINNTGLQNGGFCYYWSSSLYQTTSQAYAFYSENKSSSSQFWRFWGLPVRAVYEASAVVPNGIKFADSTVEQICLENWDADKDGVLTEAEAAEVTDIGSVFSGNENITSFDELAYFTRLKEIPYQAFFGCDNLKSVTIPSTVATLGAFAFAFSGLTSIDLPSSVEGYGNGIFAGCQSLMNITGNNASSDGRMLVVANTVIAFAPSGLTSYTIRSGIEQIWSYAFYGCEDLEKLSLPSGLVGIGHHALQYCSSLQSVNIPSSVTSIGNYAFANCGRMTYVLMNSSTPPSCGTSAFDGTRDCPIFVPSSLSTSSYMDSWSAYSSRISVKPAYSAYSSFTGKWKVAGISSDATWNIAAKSGGSTYSIGGIDGAEGIYATAVYNSELGVMELMCQENLGTLYYNSTFQEMNVYATITYSGKNYFVTPGDAPYLIMYACKSGSDILCLEPGKLMVDLSDDPVDVTGFGFYGLNQQGNYTSYDATCQAYLPQNAGRAASTSSASVAAPSARASSASSPVPAAANAVRAAAIAKLSSSKARSELLRSARSGEADKSIVKRGRR